MRRLPRSLTISALAFLALAGCSKGDDAAVTPSAPVAAVPPPAGKAWTDVVSRTPEGGFRIGNPDAAVKLVEYASYTCPHCKHFEEQGADRLLADYVPSGKLSWEFRPMSIHGGADATASLLVACRGETPYFTLGRQFFGYQDTYLNKLQPFLQAQQQRLESMAPGDQLKAMADGGGLYAFFGARGLPKAQADRCLTDQKSLDAFAASQQGASDAGVTGTPTFFINGRMLDGVGDWAKLEPQLKAALG